MRVHQCRSIILGNEWAAPNTPYNPKDLQGDPKVAKHPTPRGASNNYITTLRLWW